MRTVLTILLFVAASAQGQVFKSLKGFAEAGYQHESWTVSRTTGNLYSSQGYGGNGYYLGGGVSSRRDSVHRLGYSISVNYVQFNMNELLSTYERAQTSYAFARLTPAFCYRFPARSKFTFTGQVCASVMAALRDNERSYFQYGAKAAVGYKAYEAIIGFCFSQGKNPPTIDLTGKWNERTISLGILCYPAMLPGFRHRAKGKQ